MKVKKTPDLFLKGYGETFHGNIWVFVNDKNQKWHIKIHYIVDIDKIVEQEINLPKILFTENRVRKIMRALGCKVIKKIKK